jgi:uncharacterized protein (DUF736 family)
VNAISTRALQLLLRLLEGSSLQYSYGALDHYGAIGHELIRSGLLEPCGHQKATFAEEDGGEPVAVIFNEDRNGYGYHSPSQGWVGIDLARLGLYRPNIDRLAELLLGDDVMRPKQGPIERVPQLAWEIGTAWLTKKRQTPVWLVRRLDDRDVADKLVAELQARASPTLRLVLSTTPRRRIDGLGLPTGVVISIQDVLSSYEPNRIDFSALQVRFSGGPVRSVSEPLHLSEDGTVLTINGSEEIRFRGSGQIAAIRKLVDAHRRGQRVNAERLLHSAGLGTRQFS